MTWPQGLLKHNGGLHMDEVSFRPELNDFSRLSLPADLTMFESPTGWFTSNYESGLLFVDMSDKQTCVGDGLWKSEQALAKGPEKRKVFVTSTVVSGRQYAYSL
jgi:hypothetical protein